MNSWYGAQITVIVSAIHIYNVNAIHVTIRIMHIICVQYSDVAKCGKKKQTAK